MQRTMQRSLVVMARNEHPREICGFIRRQPGMPVDSSWWIIHPITNVSEKDDEFDMHPGELVEYYKLYLSDTIGMYHSHPGGRPLPSEEDWEHAPENMRYWIITQKGVHEWDMEGDYPREVSGSEEAVPRLFNAGGGAQRTGDARLANTGSEGRGTGQRSGSF